MSGWDSASPLTNEKASWNLSKRLYSCFYIGRSATEVVVTLSEPSLTSSQLFPLNGSWRLVRHVVPKRACTFGFELAPEPCEHALVDFGEVCGHGFGGVHRAHHDAGLVCRAERNEHDRHLPNLFVQVVCLQKFGADVVELAKRIEIFAGGVLFDKLWVFVSDATDLVNHAVDGLETVGEFGRELFAILPAKARSGDEERLRVSAAVALYAHALDGEQAACNVVRLQVVGERLTRSVANVFEFHEIVGELAVAAEQAHAEARTRERVAPHEVVRDAEFFTESTDFVLVQVGERFEHEALFHEVQNFLHAVVVRLDLVGVLGAAAFDGVGVDGALRHHPLVRIEVELRHFLVLDRQEFLADDAALGFGRGHAFELSEEVFACIANLEVVHAFGFQVIHDLLRFAEAHHAVIHMQTQDLFGAQHAVQEHECHGGINPATHEQEYLAILDLFLDALRDERQIALHVPGLLCARKIDEVFEQLHAELAVGDFGMELDTENLAFGLVAVKSDGGDFAVLGAGHNLVALGEFGDLVAVAHPHGAGLREALQKRALFVANDKVGNTVFLDLARFHVTAQLLGDKLVTVADAEFGHREVQDFGIVFRRVGRIHAGGAATVDDSLHTFQFADRGCGGVDFGKHAQSAHAVSDQVGVLPAKVQNCNSIDILHTGTKIEKIPP